MRFELLPGLLERSEIHERSLQLMDYYLTESLPEDPRHLLSCESKTHPRSPELCFPCRFVPGCAIARRLVDFFWGEPLGVGPKDFIGNEEVGVCSCEKFVLVSPHLPRHVPGGILYAIHVGVLILEYHDWNSPNPPCLDHELAGKCEPIVPRFNRHRFTFLQAKGLGDYLPCHPPFKIANNRSCRSGSRLQIER